MRRGEIWLADVGGKRRPVCVLTRNEVLDVRALVTVAEVTTQIRGLSVEVAIDAERIGLDQSSVVNCDGLHTIAQTRLATRVGALSSGELDATCWATSYALGC